MEPYAFIEMTAIWKALLNLKHLLSHNEWCITGKKELWTFYCVCIQLGTSVLNVKPNYFIC